MARAPRHCSKISCSPRLLLTGKNEETQTGQSDFVARDRRSAEYLSILTSEVRLYLYSTPGSHVCLDYHSERSKSAR